MESNKSAALVLTLLLWSCSAVASQAHELHVSRKLLDSAPPCARAGQFVADASTACKMFWQCTGSGQGTYQSCGSGTAFDSGCSCCNFPSAFTCSAAPSSTASPTSPPPATPTPAASPPPPRAASPGSSAPPPTSPTSSSPSAGSGVASYVTADLFQQIFKHTNDAACKHPNFYTYQSFTSAADAFPGFGTSKDAAINKREVAAFLAQISHETTGGPASNDDHSWGLCIDEEQTSSAYCDQSSGQCAPGLSYHGRGPIQLSWNYNYGPAGSALGFDGINNPGAVLKDATLAWKTAIRFWMTAAGSKPSCHDVMNGNWKPSSADTAAGRSSGFGTVTNIVNGGIECGPGRTNSQGGPDRIAFFQRFVSLLGTDAGSNLSCDNQQHF